jgi:hypothetical protein
MKPIDYRNETWAMVQDRALDATRLLVYRAFQLHGASTTRELSRKCGIDLLTLRPRTTELCYAGLVELVDAGSASHESIGHEGVYRAVSATIARARFERIQAEMEAPQLKLAL